MRRLGCFGIVFGVVVGIVVVGHIPVWTEDATRRAERQRVLDLVSVGDSTDQAVIALVNGGFTAGVFKPYSPTGSGTYFVQHVTVGDDTPNFFESFGYTIGASWMPFIHSEPSTIILQSTPDGIIEDIR